MKTNLILLLSVFLLTSCATRAPKTYKQICADRGMVLAGVSSDSGSGQNYYTGRTSYYGESVNCSVPRSKVEECKVVGISESSVPVDEYNEFAETRRFVSGLGYWAFILPGIGLKYAFDTQRDEAYNKGLELQRNAEQSCEVEMPETAQN